MRADDDGVRTSTSPTCGYNDTSRTGSGLTALKSEADAELSGGESERLSLSPVEDEPATSRLELFQVSALMESYEADQPTAEEESLETAADRSSTG